MTTRLVIIGRRYPGKVSALCERLKDIGVTQRESHHTSAEFCLECDESDCLLARKDELMAELRAWLNTNGNVSAFARTYDIPQQTAAKWKAKLDNEPDILQ